MRMALGGGSAWPLVAVLAVAGAALVAALAAWRAARASRAAIADLASKPPLAAMPEPSLDPPEGDPASREVVTAPDPRPRRAAATPAVVRHPQRDPVVPRRQSIEDSDPLVRVEAIRGLAEKPPVDTLLGALDDDYPIVRREAVRSLREAGGSRVTRALLDAANRDPSAEVREEAVAAIAAMLREARSEQHA